MYMEQDMKMITDGKMNITYEADYDRDEAPIIDRVYLKKWAALRMGEGTIPPRITINVMAS